MKLKTTLAVGALTAAAAVLGAGAAVAASGDQYTSASEGHYNEMYSIVRIGDPIYVHTDSGHGSMNVAGHYIASNGNLVIQRPIESGEHTVACHVLADETIARLGIEVGCSGGLTTTQIWLYRNGVRIMPDDPMFGSDKANLWVHTVGWVPAS